MKKLLISGWIVIAMGASTLWAAEGLVAYWPFDTDFTNVEGTADYDGTASGTAAISADDVKVGAGALKIDDNTSSANHVVAMGDFVGPAPVVSTVVGWYKYKDISSDGSDARNFIWETQPTYSLSFGIRDGGEGKYSQWYNDTQTGAISGNGPVVDDGRWHHAAVIWNSELGHVKYYHDGQLDQTVEVDSDNNPVLDQVGFNIGTHRAADGGRNWDGYLDEIAIFSVELSEEQILDLYERPEAVNPLNIFTPEMARNLHPATDSTDVLRDVVLSWEPGFFAVKHNVYFSSVFEDVDDGVALVSESQDVNTFDAGRLDFGQTYYWRVDEVNGTPDKTVFKGDVWRFTAEPYSIEIPGATVAVTASSASNEFSTPEKTIDGSGLDPNTGAHSINPETMWFTASVDLDPWIQYEFDDVQKLDMMKVWNSNGSAESAIGWGVKDVVIQYSVDGEAWNALEPTQFGRAPGLPTYNQYDEITLDGLAAKYVRLDIQSNWGGILMSYGLSEVKFFMIPAQARTPQPASGAADILPDSILTWRAGREAAQHTVYISSDMNAVAEGSASSVTSMTNNVELSSLSLELGETYYWRVDEVNQAEAVSMWAGPVWSFSTVAALTVDDFESYNNFSPDRPFQTWLDGFGYSSDEFFPVGYPGNATGAGIGHDIWSLSSPHYDGDIMETSSTIAGSGQSMPFYYTNSGGVASQTERTFVIAQDWTVGGAKTLAIAFRGQAGNTGTLYAKINNTKVTYPHDAGDMVRGTWQAWNIDLSSMDVQNVTKLVFGVEGSGASGMILFDDIELYPLVPSDGVSGLVAYWPFDTDFTNVEGTADYDGTPSGTAEISADDVKVGAGALKIDDNTSSANHVVATGNFVGGVPVVRTVVGWYKYKDISGDGSDARNFIWETQPTYSLSFGIRDGSEGKFSQWYHDTQGGVFFGDGPVVDDGLWHHVVMVWNSVLGHVKYYHDGQLVETAPMDTDNNPTLNQAGFNIGTNRAADGGRNWDGYLDEIAIFSVELTEEQILGLYEQSGTINPLNVLE